MVGRSFLNTDLHLRRSDAISPGIFLAMGDCHREANGIGSTTTAAFSELFFAQKSAVRTINRRRRELSRPYRATRPTARYPLPARDDAESETDKRSRNRLLTNQRAKVVLVVNLHQR